MSNFFKRHKEFLDEDASHRESVSIADPYAGRRRLDNAAIIALDRIEADPQHREHFDEEALAKLAQSLKDHGQKQPIRVRFDEERDRYIIVSGERRFRAATLAGLAELECVISDGDQTQAEILRDQVIENALREDLKPTEQGKAFSDLMKQEGFNAKELAKYLCVAPSTISRRLAVLDLPEELQTKVDDGDLSIKDAIAAAKTKPGEPSPAAKRKKKPTREKKICVGGFTVTIKARRILDEDLVRQALSQALASLEPQPLKRAA